MRLLLATLAGCAALGAQTSDVVLDAIRRRWPGVPVVLLSATPLSAGPHAGHGTQQFDACLMKPIDLSALRSVIRRVLGLNPPPFGMSLPSRPPR